jgi:hypothetical protein
MKKNAYCRWMSRLVRLLLSVRRDTVWHQDSPGVRVDVIRNNLTRLWRSPEFSDVGETHYLPTALPPNPMPINRRIHLPNTQAQARQALPDAKCLEQPTKP